VLFITIFKLDLKLDFAVSWPEPFVPELCENESTVENGSAPGVCRSERRVVSYQAETPFDNIEGSHEYVALLAEAVEDALAPLGVRITEMPLSPPAICALIERAGRSR